MTEDSLAEGDAAKGAVVITSIAAPNAVMRRIAEDCAARGMIFYVIGDSKSPADFELAGCDYYGLDAQLASGLAFAKACPTRHYARKNIGYLLAMRQKVDFIAETDDDNMPSAEFYAPLPPRSACAGASRLRLGQRLPLLHR